MQRVIDMRKGLFNEAESNYLRFVAQKSFNRLLIEAGKGKERKITLLQWVRIIKKSNESGKQSYFVRWFSASAVRFLFDLCDHNKDGSIDFDEFETLYQILGLKRGNIIFAFKQLDENRDGRLSKSEMYNAIKEFFSSSNATINNYLFGQYHAVSDFYMNKLITV